MIFNVQNLESKIILGDVITILKTLPKNYKFDVIIADPPYNIGKNFGTNNDKMEINEYVIWAKKWINLCFDKLKDDGLMYIYGFPEILARIAVKYPLEEQRWLAWHYTNKTVPLFNFWQRSYESILCLWKEKRPPLEIDQIREPYSESYLKCSGKKRTATIGRFSKGIETSFYNVNINGALPRDVIKIPALAGGAGFKERWFMCRSCGNIICPPNELKLHKNHNILKHPTQKPMKLTQKLLLSRINNANNKGKVLIPFAGSGSECVTAKLLGINFTAIECNPEYVDYANKWLSKINENKYVQINPNNVTEFSKKTIYIS